MPAVATFGFFDGVHTGHQELIKIAKSIGNESNLQVKAVTFRRHPQEVFHRKSIPLIQPCSLRVEALKRAGAETVHLLNFNQEIANLSAKDFIKDYLIEKFGCHHLVIGVDAAIGKSREWGVKEIASYFTSLGSDYSARIVPFSLYENCKVGSRTIREYVLSGRLHSAYEALGRPYSIKGRVRHGFKRGRTLGVPTANITFSANKIKRLVLPPKGVYLSIVMFSKGVFPGVSNLGVRPSVSNEDILSLETHILTDSLHANELYGEKLEVFLISFFREEIKFSSVENLKLQLMDDIFLATKASSTGEFLSVIDGVKRWCGA